MVNRYPQPDISVLQPRHSAPWPDSLLEISGEMSVRVREFDWSKTPLGPIESWPLSLRLITKTVLANKFPMCIHWGRNFIPIYNDWFIPCIGCKHPSMLGQSVREAMYEIWESIIQPIFTQVYQAGKTILNEKQLSPIRRVDRSGYLEEVYATLGYSPIYDDQEVIAGVLVTMTDTTVKILSERRLKTLRDLAERTTNVRDSLEVCQNAAEVMEQAARDIPFALIYLLDKDLQTARLVAAEGIEANRWPVLLSLSWRLQCLWKRDWRVGHSIPSSLLGHNICKIGTAFWFYTGKRIARKIPKRRLCCQCHLKCKSIRFRLAFLWQESVLD